MSRLRRFLAAALVTTGAVALVVPSGGASAATSGSAYSTTLYGNAGTMSVAATGSGPLGSTLAATLQPLVNVLNTVLATTAGVLVTGVSNAGFTASSSNASVSPPASGYPSSCTSGGWTTKTCYSATSGGGLALAGIVSLNLNAVQGYATGDRTGYYAAASVANPSLNVLGIPIGNLGVVSSAASCSAAGTCTASSSVSGVSLYNGAVRVQTGTGANGPLQVSTDGGTTWTNVSSITAPIAVGSTGLKLTADGSLLHVSYTLSLSSLLSTLGIGGLLTSLTGLDTTGTGLTLTVTLASGRSTTAGATGWGLSVGVDLSGGVAIAQTSLLGGVLGSASIGIQSGITTDPSALGNIATLQLAYSAATAGTTVSGGPTWYPPGLI